MSPFSILKTTAFLPLGCGQSVGPLKGIGFQGKISGKSSIYFLCMSIYFVYIWYILLCQFSPTDIMHQFLSRNLNGTGSTRSSIRLRRKTPLLATIYPVRHKEPDSSVSCPAGQPFFMHRTIPASSEAGIVSFQAARILGAKNLNSY